MRSVFDILDDLETISQKTVTTHFILSHTSAEETLTKIVWRNLK